MLNLADLKAALASKDKLTTDLTASKAEVDRLVKALAEAEKTAGDEKTRADGLQSQLEAGQKTIDELTGKVTTLETSSKTVSENVLETVAKLGIPAAELPANTLEQGSSAEELRAQYAKIKDPTARGAFYAKHEAQMLV